MRINMTFLLLLLLLVAAPSYAQYTIQLEDVEFDASTGTIKAFNNYDEKNIVIPSSFTIDDQAFDVVIIGTKAFQRYNLTSVSIPNTVTTICSWAFYRNDIKTINFPEHLKEIGAFAFQYNRLETVAFPEGVTEIQNYAFSENDLSEVTLSAQTTMIGDYAFEVNKIEEITLPEGLLSIGDYAFSENYLTNIVLPQGIERIGSRSFGDNTISSLIIPNSMIEIGSFAFYRNSLMTVQFDEESHIKTIGQGAFKEAWIGGFILPKNVNETYEYYADDENNRYAEGDTIYDLNLEVRAVIPYVLTADDVEFDKETGSIVKFTENGEPDITIPGVFTIDEQDIAVTTIKKLAFKDTELMSVRFSDQLKTIEHDAFATNKLNEVILPNNITFVGRYAFFSNVIRHIKFSNAIDTIREGTFLHNSLPEVTIPEHITCIEDAAFSYNGLCEIDVDHVPSLGEGVFSQNFIKKANLNDSLPSIPNRLFYKCSLDSIDIPETVTKIGELAFSDNDLKEVVIPNLVYSIGPKAFDSNYFLDTIMLPSHPIYAENGWIDANGNTYAAGDQTAVLTTSYRIKDLYTISYNLDGGTMEGNNSEMYEKSTGIEFDVVPIKDGMIFMGWYNTNKSGVITADGTIDDGIYHSGIPVNTEGDLTLTAKWGHRVIFNDWDDAEIRIDTIEHNTTIVDGPIPNREGYTFIGWDFGDITITEDIVLTAVYTVGTSSDAVPTSSSYAVFPNPAKHMVIILGAEGKECTIYTLSGQLIQSVAVSTDRQSIDLTSMQHGVYMISIGNTIQRLIIAR